jgi:hypothetical protein
MATIDAIDLCRNDQLQPDPVSDFNGPIKRFSGHMRPMKAIVTHSSPAARDGRTFAVASWTIIRANPCHHAVGIRRTCAIL